MATRSTPSNRNANPDKPAETKRRGGALLGSSRRAGPVFELLSTLAASREELL
jgi:hypothetical protein